MSKRVLIITYYWPPSGGAGVQRWLKFVKYLPEFGWQPVVYTPENPEVPAEDISLLDEIPKQTKVIKTRIWEPYSYYKKFVGRKKNDKIKTGFLSESKTPPLTEKISTWIRGNLFIPDARKYWISPSVKFLSNFLGQNPVDAIISTGPPHSMHMIALHVNKLLHIPWLADFRDPWTNIDFYSQLMLTQASDRKHHELEKMVLTKADQLVTVSWNWAKDFEKLGAKKIEVVTNGFDPQDFNMLSYKRGRDFKLVHLGSLNRDRNQNCFWEALSELLKENIKLKNHIKIELIGQIDFSVTSSINKYGLNNYVEKISYMPHKEVLKKTSNADVLFLPLNNTPHAHGIIPGKIFEYLAMKRPILCIGPKHGDSAKIISECNAGTTVDFYEKAKLKTAIENYFNAYLNDELYLQTNDQVVNFSRKKLAGRIAELLDRISN